MAFHRLSVPAYFGGLPVGYDYINNPPLNGDAGVAAFADAKKASGVNAGTYFVAFNEDATSSDANRGVQAVAQNTDALDDILRKDVAFTARTSDVTAGSPVASVVIAGQIYVGDFGVTNNQQQRDLLISVLDNNDNELLVGTTKVQASLIHDGASTNVVGTQTSGFFNTPTVNFNVSIPAGVTYRVYYGFRGNLATMPKDAFTNIRIRGAQEVEASVERVLRDLHTTVGSPNWDDPWVATINTLARSGLDGRYRLSTTDPGTSTAVNTPGNGGTILRDGPAPAVSFPTVDLTAVGTAGVNRYPDAILAAWRVKRAAPIVGTTYNSALGGDIGLVQESTYHNYTDAAEVAFTHISNGLLLDVIPRNITASTLAAHNVRSRIGSAGVGSVNPTAGSDATSRRTIQVAAGDFISNGAGNIGVRKTDLIEVTDNVSGLVVGTFHLDTVLTATTFTVKTVTGALPPLGPSGATAAIRLRWLQTAVSVGGQNMAGLAGDFHGIPQLFVAAPGLLTDDPDSNASTYGALFLSAMAQRSLGATNEQLFQALAWGGFDNLGGYGVPGALLGDGGITTTGGRQTMNMFNRRSPTFMNLVVPEGGRTLVLEPIFGGSVINAHWDTGLTTTSSLVVSIDTTQGYVPRNGDEIAVNFQMAPATSGKITVTWPGDFIFSGGDAVIPLHNMTTSYVIVQYIFRYQVTTAGGGWYAERRDY